MKARSFRRIFAALLAGMVVVASSATAQDALFTAAVNGDAAQVKQLLDKGASANAADQDGATALMRAVSRRARNEQAHGAARKGNALAVVKLLLERGAKINAADRTGGTALMWAMEGYASESGIIGVSQPVAQLLIESGADVNRQDLEGQTALLGDIGCRGGSR